MIADLFFKTSRYLGKRTGLKENHQFNLKGFVKVDKPTKPKEKFNDKRNFKRYEKFKITKLNPSYKDVFNQFDVH